MTDRASPFSRRRFLAASSAVGLGVGGAGHASSRGFPRAPERDPFRYEIRRSEEEWRALLSEADYDVLRRGQTELPATSEVWDETRPGDYGCRGCNLHVYSSEWKVPLDKGWAFFAHAEPNAVLTGIDGPDERYDDMGPGGPANMIEVHCRRCGSHLGHILLVDDEVLHCINGRSLTFAPRAG